MTMFSSRNQSTAEVPAPRSAIWRALTDPDQLARLTPLVRTITVDGTTWCWQLDGVRALGVEVAPAFTEEMTFVPESLIEFAHRAPAGEPERGGADGTYELAEVAADRTQLSIDITISVDLPLPRVSRRAVERVMAATMQRTGDQFARNLYEHLGLDPALLSRPGGTRSSWPTAKDPSRT